MHVYCSLLHGKLSFYFELQEKLFIVQKKKSLELRIFFQMQHIKRRVAIVSVRSKMLALTPLSRIIYTYTEETQLSESRFSENQLNRKTLKHFSFLNMKNFTFKQ